MHAHALEIVAPYLDKQRQKAQSTSLKLLDVGCGSGYVTACFGRWFKPKEGGEDEDGVGKTATADARENGGGGPGSGDSPEGPIMGLGTVFGIDVYPELVEHAKRNIQREDGDLLSSGTVSLRVGNGWNGLPDEVRKKCTPLDDGH